MADFANSDGFIVRDTWYEGLGKQIVCRRVEITLSGQGTTANAIPATECNLDLFEGNSILTKDDNSAIVIGAPSADRTKLLLKAAGSAAPADQTGTFYGVLRGR